MKNLQEVITPLVSRPHSKEPAQAYEELIASPVHSSNEKWPEYLTSHGLTIDTEWRTLAVQSRNVNTNTVYGLMEEEVEELATVFTEEQSVEKWLDLLNGIIGADFADKVTMEWLNSEQRISIGLRLGVWHGLEKWQRQEQELSMQQEAPMQQEHTQGNTSVAVDGRDLQLLNGSRSWYHGEKYGREVEVGDIAV